MTNQETTQSAAATITLMNESKNQKTRKSRSYIHVIVLVISSSKVQTLMKVGIYNVNIQHYYDLLTLCP